MQEKLSPALLLILSLLEPEKLSPALLLILSLLEPEKLSHTPLLVFIYGVKEIIARKVLVFQL